MTLKPLGLAAIGLAIAFNIPFSLLAARFDYPAILRQPAAEVLAAFAQGGPGLIVIWYGFALSALALVPFAVALAFDRPDWLDRPALAIGAAITGALAGFAQAVGLVRWVFAVPVLAALHADPSTTDVGRAAAEMGFTLLNQWGGVGIGEHLGQALTILWIGMVALSRAGVGGWLNRAESGFAALAILGIGIGLGEGPSLALGRAVPAFGLATILGYMAFTLWLVTIGIILMRRDLARAALVTA